MQAAGEAKAFNASAELRRQWGNAVARAARANRSAQKSLDYSNLVLKPQPKYWQNAPDAPFHELFSEDSK